MKATFSNISVDGGGTLSITVSYFDGNDTQLLSEVVRIPIRLFSEESLRLAVNQKLSALSTPCELPLADIQAALAVGESL